MLSHSTDLHHLDEDLAQQVFVLRFMRQTTERITPDQIRAVDEAIDDFTAARRCIARLMGRQFNDPCKLSSKQRSFELGAVPCSTLL